MLLLLCNHSDCVKAAAVESSVDPILYKNNLTFCIIVKHIYQTSLYLHNLQNFLWNFYGLYNSAWERLDNI